MKRINERIEIDVDNKYYLQLPDDVLEAVVSVEAIYMDGERVPPEYWRYDHYKNIKIVENDVLKEFNGHVTIMLDVMYPIGASIPDNDTDYMDAVDGCRLGEINLDDIYRACKSIGIMPLDENGDEDDGVRREEFEDAVAAVYDEELRDLLSQLLGEAAVVIAERIAEVYDPCNPAIEV